MGFYDCPGTDPNPRHSRSSVLTNLCLGLPTVSCFLKILCKKKKTNLNLLGELIIAVNVHRRELPDVVELELDLQRFVLAGVVPPANPALLLGPGYVGLEVVRALEPVGQLSESASELVAPVAVVGGVEELLVTAFVALGHGVGHDTVVPGTSVQLDPHADSATVKAVGQEANLARPDRRIQIVLDLEIGVLVARYNLQLKSVRQILSRAGIGIFVTTMGI